MSLASCWKFIQDTDTKWLCIVCSIISGPLKARAVAQRKEAERKSRAQARLNLRRAIEAEMEEVLVGSWTDVDGICFVTRSHVSITIDLAANHDQKCVAVLGHPKRLHP